jgi:hypothetical protein
MFVHNPRFLEIKSENVLKNIGEIKNINTSFGYDDWHPEFQNNNIRFNKILEPQGIPK